VSVSVKYTLPSKGHIAHYHIYNTAKSVPNSINYQVVIARIKDKAFSGLFHQALLGVSLLAPTINTALKAIFVSIIMRS
jgi:hypothetical protein